ncbi:MAG TPA: hypothetical protein VEM93_00405, partial [Actinomycetota bacterium]|nr:hypothetical protein [Actinomycetota bacterium]
MWLRDAIHGGGAGEATGHGGGGPAFRRPAGPLYHRGPKSRPTTERKDFVVIAVWIILGIVVLV